MIRGVRYYSFVEASGYGLASVAYVRGLVNAGVRVQWIPLRHRGWSAEPLPPGEPPALAALAIDDASLRDLDALLFATSLPVPHDTVIAHTVPEHWPLLFEPGKRNVGMTVWETDAPPAHWPPLLELADRVLVPCTMNRGVFEAAGVRTRVQVVPHIRRHAFNRFTRDEVAAARERFGIPADDFVFYTVNAWDPRKALPALLYAYTLAFEPDTPVTLVVKTGPIGYGPGPLYERAPTTELASAAIEEAEARVGREATSVCLLPYELTGRGVDLLHEIGDCYVSLAHGEGWALGAFDAATRGTPVVMTGWGGHCDYLGERWSGAIDYRLARVPVWPPQRPTYWPSQRWAEPDPASAVEALRRASQRLPEVRAEAARIEEAIVNRYAEPVVTRELIAAIDG